MDAHNKPMKHWSIAVSTLKFTRSHNEVIRNEFRSHPESELGSQLWHLLDCYIHSETNLRVNLAVDSIVSKADRNVEESGDKTIGKEEIRL